MERRKTRAVRVGSVEIGHEAPISIQTMWKRPLSRSSSNDVIAEVQRLGTLGCDILRFAVPDMDSAVALGELSGRVGIPLVADIHFDHRLALACLDYPIAKIRINPGNIGARWKVEEVAAKASDRGVPIRIGVNGGSLPRHLAQEKDLALAMVKAADEEIEVLESLGFHDIVISMKASDAEATVRANRVFAASHDHPLHVGLTEAGPLVSGIVKSALALADLLADGIGDTVRVSLSDSPETEVLAAREILGALGLRKGGVRLVSCPCCGRAGFDVHGFLAEMREELYALPGEVSVAVMGCVVNGPGEARHADIGISGSGEKVVIFRKGEIVRTVPTDRAVEAFREELARL